MYDIKRKVNVTFLKYFAAFFVFYHHAFSLFNLSSDPVAKISPHETLGTLAVKLFSIISGYLIVASLQRNATTDFYKKRFLKIFPPLWACCIFCVFIIGLASTRLLASKYLLSAGTYKYLFANSLLISIVHGLPGVFESNPYPSAINGSLWYLGVISSLYLACPLLKKYGFFEKKLIGIIVMIVALIYVFAIDQIRNQLVSSFLMCYFAFFIGATLYQWRQIIVMSTSLLMLLIAMTIILSNLPVGQILSTMLIAYCSIYFIEKVNVPYIFRSILQKDISYEFFLYAFPIQQTIMALNKGTVSFATYILVSFLTCLLIAIIANRVVIFIMEKTPRVFSQT